MERQYVLRIKVIECYDELMRSKALEDLWKAKGIRIKRRAPHTQAQNGDAERSGGVIKLKAKANGSRLSTKWRFGTLAAKLPDSSWQPDWLGF